MKLSEVLEKTYHDSNVKVITDAIVTEIDSEGHEVNSEDVLFIGEAGCFPFKMRGWLDHEVVGLCVTEGQYSFEHCIGIVVKESK